MKTCPSCGGIIGQDCFNPDECAWITHQQAQQEQQSIIDRIEAFEQLSREKDELIDRLVKALSEHHYHNCFCHFQGTCLACQQLKRKNEALSLAHAKGYGKK